MTVPTPKTTTNNNGQSFLTFTRPASTPDTPADQNPASQDPTSIPTSPVGAPVPPAAPAVAATFVPQPATQTPGAEAVAPVPPLVAAPPAPPVDPAVTAATPHSLSPQVAAPPVVAAWPAPTQAAPPVAAPMPPPVGASHPAMMAASTSTSVVVHNSVRPFKSPGVAAALAFFFGPLGMLYATIPGAAVIFAANLVIAVITFITFGLGAFLWFGTWIAGVVWAVVAANQRNQQASTTTVAVGTGMVA